MTVNALVTAETIHHVVGAEAAARAIVVQGWPLGGPAAVQQDEDGETALREALTAVFGTYGKIVQLAFSDEKRTAAVLVFAEEGAAAQAASFTGSILGATAVVTKPVAGSEAGAGEGEGDRLLGGSGGGGGSVGGAIAREELPVLAQRAADVCAEALSGGFLLAQRGVERLKEADAKAGVSRKLQDLDDRQGLSRQAKAAAEKLGARAQVLDEKLKLSDGLRDTADRVKETAAVLTGAAAELSERAIRQSPALAQGAQRTTLALRLAEAWGKRTLEAAKEKIESRGGVLPGSARGDGHAAAPATTRSLGGSEYEPLMAPAAAASTTASSFSIDDDGGDDDEGEENEGNAAAVAAAAGPAGVGGVVASPGGEEEVPIQL